MDKKQIGRRIRTARVEKGWTQQDLADAFSCSQANISDMERGEVSIDLMDLERLAQVLGKSLYYFFPGDESSSDGFEQVAQVMSSVPDGRIREEAIHYMLAIARDASQRAGGKSG